MSITNLNTNLINEIALRCGDSDFEDFNKTIYQQCFYRGARTVSKHLNLLERIFITTVSSSEGAFSLNIPNFKDEIRVRINDIVYEKSNFDEDLISPLTTEKITTLTVSDTTLDRFDSREMSTKGKYQLAYVEDQLVIDWLPRASNDEIFIHYIALPDIEDTEDCFPSIPKKYEEVLIEYSIKEIVKLGLAKFTDEAKLGKYTRLAQLYNSIVTKKEDVKNKAWVTQKIWNPL